MAFFRASTVNAPDAVALIEDGGACRSPGPSTSGLLLPWGKTELGTSSPGSNNSGKAIFERGERFWHIEVLLEEFDMTP